jgi:hypothetical protein
MRSLFNSRSEQTKKKGTDRNVFMRLLSCGYKTELVPVLTSKEIQQLISTGNTSNK